MFITPVVMLGIIVFFILLNIKNRFSQLVALYYISIVFMCIFAAIYMSKIRYYNFPLRIDYVIYLRLSSIRVSLTVLSRLMNLSFAVFMFAAVIGARIIGKLKWKYIVVLSIPIVLFLIYTDTTTSVKIDVQSHLREGIYRWLKLYGNEIFKYVFVFYMLLPIWYCWKFYKAERFLVNKQHIIIYGLCILMITVFVCLLFIFGVFRVVMFYNLGVGKLPVEMGSFEDSQLLNAYIKIPLATFSIMLAVIMLLLYFRPFNMFSFENKRNKDIVNTISHFCRVNGMNLHNYKNIFWCGKQQFVLIQNALEAGNYETASDYVKFGIEMMDELIDDTRKNINNMSLDFSDDNVVDVIESMETAISRVSPAFKGRFIKKYHIDRAYICGNSNMLTEVFYNLIMNSVESFTMKNGECKPEIRIEVCQYSGMCLIEIEDNGSGIASKDIRKIFEPFHSTKVGNKNFGIGLSYVYMVLKAYHGRIDVKSEVNKYTSVQVVLPLLKSDRKVIR